jgi:hypothetical protein
MSHNDDNGQGSAYPLGDLNGLKASASTDGEEWLPPQWFLKSAVTRILSTDNYWDSGIGHGGAGGTRCLLPDLALLVAEYVDATSIFGTLSIIYGQNRLLGSAWSLISEITEARNTTSEWGQLAGASGFVISPDQVIVDAKRRVLYLLRVSYDGFLSMTRLDLLTGRHSPVNTSPTHVHQWVARYGVSAVVLGDSMWILGNIRTENWADYYNTLDARAARYDLKRNAWDTIGPVSLDGFKSLQGAACAAISLNRVLISGGGGTTPLVKSCHLLSEELNTSSNRIIRTLTNAIPDLSRLRANHEMVLVPGADAVFVAEGQVLFSSPHDKAITGLDRSTEVLSLRPLRKFKDGVQESGADSAPNWMWRPSVPLPSYLATGIPQKLFGVGDSVLAQVRCKVGDTATVMRLRICADCAECRWHHSQQFMSCDTPEFRDWYHLLEIPAQCLPVASFCIQ